MRAAFHKTQVYRDEAGKIIGIASGTDHCAEHEWGMSEIRQALNCTGFEARNFGAPVSPLITDRINIDPKKFSRKSEVTQTSDSRTPYVLDVLTATIDKKKVTALVLTSAWHCIGLRNDTPYSDGEVIKNCSVPYNLKTGDLAASWDSKGFCFATTDKEVAKFFTDLRTAMFEGKALLTMGGSANPFCNGSGVNLLLDEAVDATALEQIIADRESSRSMYKKVDDTGIEKKLKDAGKRYYALSPKLMSDGELKFWLNPADQKNNNYGWYTVEQLEQWVNNEGPIPMKKG